METPLPTLPPRGGSRGGIGGGGGIDPNYLPPPPPPPQSQPPFTFQANLLDFRSMTNQLTSIFKDYKGWISRNPGRASDVESFVKILAYLLPGRIRGNSTVLPELLYSTANVVSFWHDHILQKQLEAAQERHKQQQERQAPLSGRRRQNGRVPHDDEQPSTSNGSYTVNFNNNLRSGGDACPSGDGGSRRKQIFRIQACLSILEYFEVFFEVAARKLWGDAARWMVVFLVQAVKACLRSILVFYYKVGLTRYPAVPLFDRTKYQPSRVTTDQTVVFVLKHSGRVIRKLNASPPFYSRDWTVPEIPLSFDTERNLPPQNLLAEVIHIARPLCHLMSLGACGTSSWKPWLLSLAMDVSSLYLHGDCLKQHHKSDQMELQRRTVSLLLYLLRSPFYDQTTKTRLLSSLEGVGNRVPLVGNLLLLLAKAIPQWQSTYSYVWS